MYRPLITYDKNELGYYINYVTSDRQQPFQVVGTLSDYQVEVNRVPYFNDDWFSYITQECWYPRLILSDGGTSTASGNVSRIDYYLQKNYSHRRLFDDDFRAIINRSFTPSSTADYTSAPMIYHFLANEKVRILFDNKREEYNRLWEIQTSDYDPLKDYDETETETHSGTDTTEHSGKDSTQNSGRDTTTKTGSESLAHTGSDTVADSGSDTTNDSTYAFDSVSEVNKDKSVNTYGKSTSTTFNDTETTTYNSIADQTAYGLKTELTHGETIDIEYGKTITKTKSGSNLSPTELLEKHRAMWESYNFLGIVAEDIAKFITC